MDQRNSSSPVELTLGVGRMEWGLSGSQLERKFSWRLTYSQVGKESNFWPHARSLVGKADRKDGRSGGLFREKGPVSTSYSGWTVEK